MLMVEFWLESSEAVNHWITNSVVANLLFFTFLADQIFQNMQIEIERDYGVQPIAQILEDEGFTAKDLVKSSKVLITHKMVSRACKGRRLSSNVRVKVLQALEAASGKSYKLGELFNYLKPKS